MARRIHHFRGGGANNAPTWTRRSALAALAAGAAGAVLPNSGDSAADAKAAAAIDAHTHFYDPTRPEGVPWPNKDDKLLYRPVLPDELKRLTRDLGVSGTIAVEASPWLEDNQWLLDLAARDPFIVSATAPRRMPPSIGSCIRILRRKARACWKNSCDATRSQPIGR